MASLEMVRTYDAVPMAAAPYQPRRRSLSLFLSHCLGLMRVMVTEYRTTWFLHVFFGFLMPLGMIFFLKYVGGEIDQNRAIFLVGGNITTSIAYGPTMILISKIAWGRHTRDFDYWAALPLPKLALVAAMVGVALLLATPGILGVYLLGSLMLGLPLGAGPALLVLVPLGALSLAGFGAFLGVFAKDGPTGNLFSNALIGVVTFLSPTMIPLEAMPAPLKLLAVIMPTTYSADAFRQALAGNFGRTLAYDVLVLLFFTAVFLTLVHRKLDWRSA